MVATIKTEAWLQRLLAGLGNGAILLLAGSVLAICLANSPWSSAYQAVLDWGSPLPAALFHGGLSFREIVNDGLMAGFFLLVGLEIKRELLAGELASARKAALPIGAAVGGMAAPALLYLGVAWNDPDALGGWAIPAATDIAFALAALSLLGSRIPTSLKVFLSALAIIDDLGAVLIIAVFYTGDISWPALGLAGGAVLALYSLNRSGVSALWPYLLIGPVLWLCLLNSGVHATLAGVVLAMTIPLRGLDPVAQPPLLRLEHKLQPFVACLVLPLFGLCNAGLPLAGLSLGAFGDPVPLGIMLGLVVGKPLGVIGVSLLMVRSGMAQLPSGATLKTFAGVAMLCGIGFTMSLFISDLAFDHPRLVEEARAGILAGSLLSALLGIVWLWRLAPAR